jgi:hypothetical protein
MKKELSMAIHQDPLQAEDLIKTHKMHPKVVKTQKNLRSSAT